MRFKLLFAGIAVATLAGCMTAAERGLRAYRRGDFVRAGELLSHVDPHSSTYDSELTARVHAAMQYSVDYLLGRAHDLERDDAMACREILAFYEAALASMPAKHPLRTKTAAAIAAVNARADTMRAKHDRAVNAFEAAARAYDFDTAVTELARVVKLRRCSGRGAPAPTSVLELARAAMEAQRPDVAVVLVNLADELRREDRRKVDPSVADTVRLAAALRFLNRPDDPDAETRDSEHSEQPGPARASRDLGPLTLEPRRDVEQATAARLARVREQLAQARQQFAAGELVAAFGALDSALREVGDGPGSDDLEAQAREWAQPRERLVADLVLAGERALARQDTAEAYRCYRQVLSLAPDHEVARDRLRKLEKLRRIQGDGAAAAVGSGK